ncbi:MAG: helix-turn-helix domain-containing protein [Clostridia bacterium]|nr:helix-turn-helix domain-containing protein [Clostridia bacterium]
MTVSFAERLRKLRTEKGLSQQQLAVKMMVDRSSIARWENGTRSPDITLMPRLAECLGVDVSDLLDDGSADHAIPRIILVDDEKPNLAGAVRILCETLPGAEITGFLRPSEALMFARSNPVNLAILDIELGRSNGFELCEKLTALHPETNVVFLTAWPEHSLEAWKTKACGFLVKPLLPADVLAILPKLKYPLPDSIFNRGGTNP